MQQKDGHNIQCLNFIRLIQRQLEALTIPAWFFSEWLVLWDGRFIKFSGLFTIFDKHPVRQ